MDSLTELFCFIDDFCCQFEPALERRLLDSGSKGEEAQALQRVEFIRVDDLGRFVPSIALSPVQEFLSGLRVPPLAD